MSKAIIKSTDPISKLNSAKSVYVSPNLSDNIEVIRDTPKNVALQ